MAATAERGGPGVARWHSVHVAYHDDQDALLVDAVRPLFDRVRDRSGLTDTYFLRHWRRGPHVRLNFRTDPATFMAGVRPAADEIVGGYLAAHPSTTRLDPERLLPLHRQLAAVEEEPGPLVPWYPNNSLQDADHDDRLHVLGSSSAADLLTEFYVRTTGLALEVTEHVRRQRAPRLGVAFDLMLATAHGFSASGDITRGFVSFRSHAEAFLHSAPDGQRLRAAWDAHSARQRRTLTRRVREVVETLEGQGPVPFVAAWVATLAPVRRQGQARIETGQIALDPAPAGAGGSQDAEGGSPRADLEDLSPFHRELSTSRRWRRDVMGSTGFAAYRLMLNYTYLQLTRLGVTPGERFMLCHLAANAVEEAYGVSALEVAGG